LLVAWISAANADGDDDVDAELDGQGWCCIEGSRRSGSNIGAWRVGRGGERLAQGAASPTQRGVAAAGGKAMLPKRARRGKADEQGRAARAVLAGEVSARQRESGVYRLR
jgi:hypothetical protein